MTGRPRTLPSTTAVEAKRKYSRERGYAAKRWVMRKLAPEGHCMCSKGCSEHRVFWLAIDHRYGRTTGIYWLDTFTGSSLWAWIRDNWDEYYDAIVHHMQVLCHGCNFLKNDGEECRHDEESLYDC